MADKTGIQWAEATWNCTTGCDRISPGCDHCYALTMAGRLKLMGSAKYQNDGNPRTSGPGFGLTVHPHALDQPLRWTRPRFIFVNSMSDLFHEGVNDGFLADAFGVMAVARKQHGHVFQILTKRTQRMASFFHEPKQDWTPDSARRGYHAPASYRSESNGMPLDYPTAREAVASAAHRWAMDRVNAGALSDSIQSGRNWPLDGVWLGTSIESARYLFRADHVRETPAALRFLSLEPLLGPLPLLDLTDIGWVIAGAESGKGARPMDEGWVREIRDKCVEAGVPFFYKQNAIDGKKIGTPELDGRRWTEMPGRNVPCE